MPSHPAPSFRPRVEGLDDRLVPATFTVTTTNNSGEGSLRAAINLANDTAGADTIAFNIPGAGTKVIKPTKALPAITETVTIDGSTQPGFTSTPLVVLNGKNAGASDGLVIQAGADASTVKALVINRFAQNGIVIGADNSKVHSCYIGSNPAGTAGAANGLDGVRVLAGASGNTIGGTEGGNLLAGNLGYGVNISGDGADGNTVARNSIGNNTAGGVRIADGAADNTVGGSATNLANTIAANGGHGILIVGAGTTGNTVASNFIGTNSSGTAAFPNTLDGVAVFDGASNNKIGLLGFGNLISGNTRYGVNIRGEGTTGNVLLGNFVGTNGTGGAALGNGSAGIRVGKGADGNTIGGSVNGSTNTISGNKAFGVIVSASDQTVIRGNRIGTAVNGTTALGNGSHGVFITKGASNTAVGGVAKNDSNLIANNAGNGVLIGSDPAAGFTTAAGSGNSVLGTALIANAKLGIDLGPNNGVNAAIPVSVTGADIAADNKTIGVTVAVSGPSGATFRVEVYGSPEADPSGFGEGRFLLGVIEVTAGAGPVAGAGSFTYATEVGTKITATATNLATNETSEFSAVVTAT